jgi:hypothetical protein
VDRWVKGIVNTLMRLHGCYRTRSPIRDLCRRMKSLRWFLTSK